MGYKEEGKIQDKIAREIFEATRNVASQDEFEEAWIMGWVIGDMMVLVFISHNIVDNIKLGA